MLDVWGALAGIGVLLSIPIIAALIFLNVYAEDRRPPAGLFPLTGRWLRYLFDAVGILLLVLSSPFWIWFIGPALLVGWVSDRLDNAASRRKSSRGRLTRARSPQASSGASDGLPPFAG